MRIFQFDPFAHRPKELCTVGALRAEAAAAGVDTAPAACERAHRRSVTTRRHNRTCSRRRARESYVAALGACRRGSTAGRDVFDGREPLGNQRSADPRGDAASPSGSAASPRSTMWISRCSPERCTG